MIDRIWKHSSGPQATFMLLHAEADVLEVGVLVQAVLGAFLAKARVLEASEGRLAGGDEPFVHAHQTHLQRLRHPPYLTQVIRIEVT